MQGKTTLRWKEGQVLDAIFNSVFATLWKCSLFLDEMEKYDRMSKTMRREDRRQEY